MPNESFLAEFPPVTTEQWEAVIRKDLKGADYGKKLLWQTDEGITVRPYYRREDLAGLTNLDATPGEFPYVRGVSTTNDWEIRETPPAGVIRGDEFLEAGGTAVQELGYTLAAGIERMRQAMDEGRSADEAAGCIEFCFAIGASYFFQIAKLRAFRLLWARAVERFGGSRESAKATIHGRTARWNKSIYDSHVNILRATTEAMSAAMGGCDSLFVEPFDAVYRHPDELSRRLARNTQIILKKEALLERAVDPGGGSYYIESLTGSLAHAAWKLMQEIESVGGFSKAEQSGMIPEQLAESRKKKEAAVASRRRVFLGVNQYPDAGEKMLDRIEHTEDERYGRGPEVFEDIRLRTERHAASTGRTPLFLLAEIGDLKMRKARAAFAQNLFGCAGFEIRIAVFENLDAIAGESADAVVLCSSDAEYLEILRASNYRPAHLIIAGYPKESLEELKRLGAEDFVHIRSNAAETLAAWQDRLGVRG